VLTLSKLAKRYEAEVEAHQALVRLMARDLHLWGQFWKLFKRCTHALETGHKLVLFGNGGSAADAQHIAAELVVKYAKHRKAIPAIALTTDTSVLTAIVNDFGPGDIFARQVRAICQPGDVVIGITTSGQSVNIHRGLDAAKNDVGAWTVALTGMHYRNRLADVSHLVLHVPSEDTPRIQEMHIMLGHILCSALEEELHGSHSEIQ
jgi:D-sedoheptulose 7-phosphate isomerase